MFFCLYFDDLVLEGLYEKKKDAVKQKERKKKKKDDIKKKKNMRQWHSKREEISNDSDHG